MNNSMDNKETVFFDYKYPSDWKSLCMDFGRLFHVSMVDFFDPLMSAVMKNFSINIKVFDDYLHHMFGEYEEQGLNMQEMVRTYYGPKAVELLNVLI